MSRIFDAFMFNDELDMLECRLTEIGDLVDAVIIVESDAVHRGNRSKPLHYHENAERFAPWHDKIVHVVARGLPSDPDPSAREHGQREFIWEGLRRLGAEPDDILIQSDVDEIPTRDAVRSLEPHGTVAFRMRLHPYAVDWRHPRCWQAASASPVREVGSMQAMRAAAPHNPLALNDAGWHLSRMSDRAAARTREIDAFGHPGLNDERPDRLDDCWESGIHTDGVRLDPVTVTAGQWPRWVTDGNAPAGWFRPPGSGLATVLDDETGRLLELAREALGIEAWSFAADLLARVLATPERDADERAVAALLIAFAHQELAALDPAVATFNDTRRCRWLTAATELAPDTRGPWVELASYRWDQRDAPAAWAAAEHALAARRSTPAGFDRARDWDWMAHDLLSLAAWHTGRFDDARRHAHAALAGEPAHPRLRRNVVRMAAEGASWDDLDLLLPDVVVRSKRVAVVGNAPATVERLRALGPTTLVAVGDDDLVPPDTGPFDVVLVEPEAGTVSTRQLRRWWATLAPGGWFCGRGQDPDRVAQLCAAMFCAHGVRSVPGTGDELLGDAIDGRGGGATSWAMRVPD